MLWSLVQRLMLVDVCWCWLMLVDVSWCLFFPPQPLCAAVQEYLRPPLLWKQGVSLDGCRLVHRTKWLTIIFFSKEETNQRNTQHITTQRNTTPRNKTKKIMLNIIHYYFGFAVVRFWYHSYFDISSLSPTVITNNANDDNNTNILIFIIIIIIVVIAVVMTIMI